jgi:hypothetical protein
MDKYIKPIKNLLYGFLFLQIALLGVSCKKVDNLLTFRIRNEASFQVPSAIGINTPYTVPVPDVQTNASQTFESNNADINKVKNIKLETLNLTITSPANATFRPVKSITIYITSEGLPEKRIAYKNDIPMNIGNKLILETTLENLDAYVKKDRYSLRTETTLREAIFQDIRITADMSFLVTANL